MTSLTCACGDAFKVACSSPPMTGGDLVLAAALCVLAAIVHRMGTCCGMEDDDMDSGDDDGASTMYS